MAIDPKKFLEQRMIERGISNPAERELLKRVILKQLENEQGVTATA